MRCTLRTRGFARDAGFTMIEMMVTILIFSILVTLGIPAFRSWISNVKVRSVADALQNGVRIAQTESLRRSRQVVFSLTTTLPTANGVFATATTAAANGSFWSVNVIPAMTTDAATDTAAEFVQGGALGAATGNVVVTGPASICFNSAGRLVAIGANGMGGACTLPVNNPPVWKYDVTLAGADHPLEVQVTLGGKVRLCDLSQTLSATNTYGC
jgi:type IV fimbrial biogenesis protein FimT